MVRFAAYQLLFRLVAEGSGFSHPTTLQGGSAVIVIPRKKGESVVFGDDIILSVIEIKGDKVRLGIELPEGGTVHRREVYEAILSPRGSSRNLADVPSVTQVLERIGSDDAPA